MQTFSSLFTCGGGADVGLSARLHHLWGIEVDPKSSAIANANGFSTTVGDVCQTDFSRLESPDWLHASPPCQRASVVSRGGETITDEDIASAVIRANIDLRPSVFSLENVSNYRNFSSYRRIKSSLISAGYDIRDRVLDSADFGVPQTRKRLWLVAAKGRKAQIPTPTHENPKRIAPQLFSEFERLPWVSWNEAIEGMETPEDYELTDSMLSMIPKDFKGVALMTGFHLYTGKNRSGLTIRPAGMPSPTLLAKMRSPSARPLIIRREGNELSAKVLGVRHMARIQSFPDGYDWVNQPLVAYSAIGNAVSPKVMTAIVDANNKA